MSKYVIDSYAWIEYFRGSKEGEKVKNIVEEMSNEIITPLIVVSEVTSISKREQQDPEEAYRKIIALSAVAIPTVEVAKEVGILHAEIRKKINDFGMGDTFVLVTARRMNAKIMTGDPHFKGFKEAINIK